MYSEAAGATLAPGAWSRELPLTRAFEPLQLKLIRSGAAGISLSPDDSALLKELQTAAAEDRKAAAPVSDRTPAQHRRAAQVAAAKAKSEKSGRKGAAPVPAVNPACANGIPDLTSVPDIEIAGVPESIGAIMGHNRALSGHGVPSVPGRRQ